MRVMGGRGRRICGASEKAAWHTTAWSESPIPPPPARTLRAPTCMLPVCQRLPVQCGHARVCHWCYTSHAHR